MKNVELIVISDNRDGYVRQVSLRLRALGMGVARGARPMNPVRGMAAFIGVPIYVRVETSISLSLALLEKSMSLGAIMALVIGGAGASIPEVSMLTSIFKARLVGAFVIAIMSVAATVGFAFNDLFS